MPDPGAAYILERRGGRWEPLRTITPVTQGHADTAQRLRKKSLLWKTNGIRRQALIKLRKTSVKVEAE